MRLLAPLTLAIAPGLLGPVFLNQRVRYPVQVSDV